MSKLGKIITMLVIIGGVAMSVYFIKSTRHTPKSDVQTQDATFDLGRLATSKEILGWHIDARPDGHGLPEGRGGVLDGKALYEEQCAACHGDKGEGVDKYPALVGGQNSLTSEKPLKTVGSYWPYSSTLWDYIKRAMPFGNARSLSDDEVYALTAYILHMNGLIEEHVILDYDKLIAIKMPNADGFFTEPNKDALYNHNERCMTNCKSEVIVEKRAK